MRPFNQTRTPRIFIIEDSVTDCLLMSGELQQAGYEVSVANDGREGIQRVLARPPHCLILDLVLPDMNGYAICRQLRTVDTQHTMPIVIVSTKGTPVDQKYLFGLGADRYLVKPFTGETLVQTVMEVLPESLRAAMVQARQMSSKPPVHQEIATLIPYCLHEDEIMRASSPFTEAAIVLDKQTRRLYAAIDGYKSVHDLARILQLDTATTRTSLKTLWQQQRIAFYDAKRQSLKNIPELESM